MRFVSRFVLCVLLCGLSSAAWAGKINILDPPPLNGPYPTHAITGDFVLTFDNCYVNELPDASLSPDGCYAGINRTGNAITSLELTVSAVSSTVIAGQSFACNTDGSSIEQFKSTSCFYDPASDTDYFTFYNGQLGSGEPIFITEDGVYPPGLFPPMNVAVNALGPLAPTPEPSALALMGTGVVAMTGAMRSRRRSRA